MTTPANQPPVVAPPAAGGGGGNDPGGDPNGNPPADPPKTVSYESHRALLDEKKAAVAERDRLRSEIAERDRKAAEASGDWQRVVAIEKEQREAAERERDALKAQVDSVTTQHTQVRKLAAIVKATGGQVDSKWHDLIADRFMPDVVVSESGEIDQASVARAVEKLRASFPEVIQGRVHGTPNADPAASGNGAGTITYEAWRKLPSVQQKKWPRSSIVG